MSPGLTVIYALLMLEGVTSGLWIARLLPSLGVRGRTVVVLLGLRAIVSSAQIVGAAMLRVRRPSGPPLARAALVGSAMLIPLEVGLRLVPTNLDPTWRWWLVAAYWIYAGVALWALGRLFTRPADR